MDGRRPARGFTLIELLVTLAIITILVSLGVPMYGQFKNQSGVSGAAAEMVAAFNEARSRAVSERLPVQVASTRPAVAGDWSKGWQSQRVVGGVVQPVILMLSDRSSASVPLGITEAGGNNTVLFDREGRAGTTYTFSLCLKNQSGATGRTITVSPIGRVSSVNLTCP